MAKALMLVESRPTTPEQENVYNEWYQNVHLKEVCAVPGFVGGVRYRQADQQPMGAEPTGSYHAIYEIDSDNLPATYEALVTSATTTMNMSEALCMDPVATMTTWIQCGDRVTA